MTDHLGDAVLDQVFRGVPLKAPDAVHLALFTSVADAAAGTGAECAFVGYARQVATFAPAQGGVIVTAADVDFPPHAGDRVERVVAVGTFDAADGGVLAPIAMLEAPVDLHRGDIFRVAAGAHGIVFQMGDA